MAWTILQTQNTFNQYFEDVIQIGSDVFSHSFGDPFSYPGDSEKDAMLNAAAIAGLTGSLVTPDAGMMTVGQAGGTQELAISLSTGTASSTNIGLSTGAVRPFLRRR